MPDAPKADLCPVCAMPKPAGLAHCSLRCEEADPLPQPEEPSATLEELETVVKTLDLMAALKDCLDRHPAPVEGASE